MHFDRRSVVLGATAALFTCRARATAGLRVPSPGVPDHRGAPDLGSPGASSPGVQAFLAAVEAGDVAVVRASLAEDGTLVTARDGRGRSAYVLAALAGRDEVRAVLTEHGLELDVVEAVLAEDWDRVEALLTADPGLANAAHPIGGTPLYAGALVGLGNSLYRLRALGCDPDARPEGGSGFTPARGSLDARTEAQARMGATDLLGNGADPRALQRDGDSLLHGAVRRRSELLVRLVVRKGADVEARDALGRTARELALELGWQAGERLLAEPAALPRDHRASRFAFDAERRPIRRPDLAGVSRELQHEVTSASHFQVERVRALLAEDPRATFSISHDDELAIEACAHVGNRPIIELHLACGAPLSLPTAVARGDREHVRFLFDQDPQLVHERGAHDFPVMWYAALGGSGVEMAELLLAHGVSVDQESLGNTALHWCVARGDLELARWLVDHGAALEPVGYKWSPAGQTPLALAREREAAELVQFLERAGATA